MKGEAGVDKEAAMDKPTQAVLGSGDGTPSAQPGLKERGILELALHSDGRDSAGKPVDPESFFDFGPDFARHRLWDTTAHTLAPAQALPDVLGRGRVHCFTAVNEAFTFTRPDYIRASFFEPVQVYVLLVSTTKVPQWLRSDFTRLPESRAALAVDWAFGLHTKVLAVLSQKLAAIRGARLHVWERREHCVPGVRYTFGGTEGNSPLEDYTYLLAWRLLGPGEALRPGERGLRGGEGGGEGGPEGDAAVADRRALLGRIAGAVGEDDLEQLRRAVEAYRARSASAPSPWPAPSWLSSGGQPLTALAAVRNAQPRLVAYLVAQGAELDAAAFRYLLLNARCLPSAGFSDVSHLVLSLLAHQRNPIACAMACAQGLDEAAASNSAKAKDWRDLASRLRAVAVELVGCLGKLEAEAAAGGQEGAGGGGGQEGGGEEGGKAAEGGGKAPGSGAVPAAVGDVLAPKGVACSLNDASPLALAYASKDLDFMSAPVVQGHLQDRWLGPDYILLALQEKGGTFHYQDHHLLLRLLEGSGFVGPLGRPAMALHSYMLHMLVFASRAFFDSPRGRWMYKMFTEAFFLYIFHSIQLMDDEVSFVWQHALFAAYLVGWLVDELAEAAHQYGGSLAGYFDSGFNIVEACCWLMLAAATGLKGAMWALPDGGPGNETWDQLLLAKDFIYNTASILVWARLLQFIVPLHDGMGSQLMVISQMFREVFKFAVPGMILLTGVTFAIFAMFRDRDIPELTSFPNVMLKLFRTFLGETMFDLYTGETSAVYNLYGNIITLLYTLVATVVMANLLIALISYHFQPEKTEAQSRFQMAEILAHYEYLVQHHLVGAPFSGPQAAAAALLPSGARQKGSSSWVAEALSLSPMDGIVVSGENTDAKFLPTGSHEIPYLLWLLTFYPFTLALSWALYWAMAPYCVAHFTLFGYRKWTGGEAGQALPKSGSAKVAPGDAPAPAGPSSSPGAVDMMEGAGAGQGGEGGPAGPSELAPPSKAQVLASCARLLLSWAAYAATRPLWLALGAAGYCGLLGGLLVTLWLGAYTWVGKLAFHAYWVLRGWVQGWLGASNIVLASREGSGASSAPAPPTRSSALAAARGRHAAAARSWVRLQQAELRDGGQVTTWPELARALRHAGFKRSEVAAAAAGAAPEAGAAGPGAGGRGRPSAALTRAFSASAQRASASLDVQEGAAARASPAAPHHLRLSGAVPQPQPQPQPHPADAGDSSDPEPPSSEGEEEEGPVGGAGGRGPLAGAVEASRVARRVARRVEAELREAVAGIRRDVGEAARAAAALGAGAGAGGLLPGSVGGPHAGGPGGLRAGSARTSGSGAGAGAGAGGVAAMPPMPPSRPGSVHREGGGRRLSSAD